MSFERIRALLVEPVQAHQTLGAIWRAAKPYLLAGHRLHVEVRADTRSLAQNRLMWQRLTDLSVQVDHHGSKLTPDEWKIVLTAARKKQRAVPGIDGGFVVLGEQTSQMTVAEMTELLELIGAFGADKGVEFSDQEATQENQ